MAWLKKKSPNSQRQPKGNEELGGYTFRRSRTISGSASPNVKTTKRHTEMESSRLQSHHLRRRRRKLSFLLICVLILIAITYWLMSQYAINTKTIVYEPTPSVQPAFGRYSSVIDKYFSAHPIERFRFMLNDARLSEYVSQALPEVTSITSTGGEIGYGNYKIILRKPVIDWKLGTKEYLVDATGAAFSKNYYAKPSVSVIDKSNLDISNTNATIASSQLLGFLGRVVARVEATGLGKVESLTLPAGVTREVDVKLKGESYFFKTSTTRDVAAQVQDMQRVKRYLKQHNIAPEFEDIRVAGRAFYR